MLLEDCRVEDGEVGFTWQERRKRPMAFSTPPFARTVGIAEEGLNVEGLVQYVMFGEFGSVIEADCFAHCLGKRIELLGDVWTVRAAFAIERMIEG